MFHTQLLPFNGGIRQCCPIIFTSFHPKAKTLTHSGYLYLKCSSFNRNRGSARPYALQDCGTGHFKTQKTRMNRIRTITLAGNIRRPGVALLGQWNQVAWNEMSPESGTACRLKWTEQKTVSCGRKIMNKTLLLVVIILAMTSLLTCFCDFDAVILIP